jgi:hypothetical protein
MIHEKNLEAINLATLSLSMIFVYSSMSGRLGAVISPYVVELGPLTGLSWLPMAIFAAVSILRQGANSFLYCSAGCGFVFVYLADFVSKQCS